MLVDTQVFNNDKTVLGAIQELFGPFTQVPVFAMPAWSCGPPAMFNPGVEYFLNRSLGIYRIPQFFDPKAVS